MNYAYIEKQSPLNEELLAVLQKEKIRPHYAILGHETAAKIARFAAPRHFVARCNSILNASFAILD
jgi:hypothetical protein